LYRLATKRTKKSN